MCGCPMKQRHKEKEKTYGFTELELALRRTVEGLREARRACEADMTGGGIDPRGGRGTAKDG